MLFRYALQQMPTLFVFSALHKFCRKDGDSMNPSKLKNQAVPLPPRRPRLPEQKRSNRATIRPPLIPLEIPHITQGCQGIGSHDTRLMYRVTQVPQVTLFLLRSQIPSLPSLAFLPKEYSIAPQRLMVLKRSFKMTVFSRQIKLDAFGLPNAIYRQFRLCITTAHLGGRKGVGLSPYPYHFY